MPTSKMPAELLADSTRYRYGDRDPRAGAVHSAQSTVWRRGLSDAAFPESARRTFLDVLVEDPDVVTAAERVGMTFQMVYGRMAWDTEFEEQVEERLSQHCRAGDRCGTASGYRWHHGRCRACRAAKR